VVLVLDSSFSPRFLEFFDSTTVIITYLQISEQNIPKNIPSCSGVCIQFFMEKETFSMTFVEQNAFSI
jgi:hypothetical protein